MWARLRSWLGGVTDRDRVERDLRDELAFHLAEREAHWRRLGLTPDDAARRAKVEFGAVEHYKDEARHARGLAWIDDLGADLVYAWRKFRGAPSLALAVVLILAIAMGANTAVFSVLEAVTLRTLPVDRPDDLREFAWVQPRGSNFQITYDGSMRPSSDGGRVATSFSYPAYLVLRDRSTTFSDLFVFTESTVTANASDRAQRVSALLVSGNFFRGLGAGVMLGRTLGPEDDRAGAAPAAVLTHAAWQRLFGGDARVIGRTVLINDTPAVVVGITPPSFYGLEPGRWVDVVAPLTTLMPIVEGGSDRLTNPRRWAYRMMGRIQRDVSDERAQAETEAFFHQALPAGFADGGDPPRLRVTPGGQGIDSLRRNYSSSLYLLLGIMAAALIIACANTAGLLLMRAASREREMAVRLALGAGRLRLVRQVLAESSVLAVLSGVIGFLLAIAIRDALLPLLNQDETPITLTLGLSPVLLWFSVALCGAVTLICGLLPAIRATRLGADALQTRGVVQGLHRPARALAGKVLIAVQISLSLVLLFGAGLFARTLLNLRAEAIGFRADHLLLFQLDGRDAGYGGANLNNFYGEVRRRIEGAPGVESASFARYGLLSGGATTDTIVVRSPASGEQEIRVHLHFVGPGYLETMGIAVREGRSLSDGDREGALRVGVVNEALARQLPFTGSRVGKQVGYGATSPQDAALTIVGIAGDARFTTLRESAPPTLYLPYRQYSQSRVTYAVRTAGDPEQMVSTIRALVEQIDGRVPMSGVMTQEAQIDESVRRERMFAFVATGFAALAALLACIGVYGTLAYSVARRTKEIGLRIALGAARRAVVRMVLRESLVPVLAGIVIGLAAALATTRVIESMLFGVTARDAVTAVAASAFLAASAGIAGWIPSRRAARVDPMAALRAD